MNICERQYYTDMFEVNRNNLKRSCKIIKDIISKNKKRKIQNSFKIGINCSDKAVIAQTFNTYFVNVGANLANKIKDKN